MTKRRLRWLHGQRRSQRPYSIVAALAPQRWPVRDVSMWKRPQKPNMFLLLLFIQKPSFPVWASPGPDFLIWAPPHTPMIFLILLFMKLFLSGLGASRDRFLHLGALSGTQHFLSTSLYNINYFRAGHVQGQISQSWCPLTNQHFS